MKFIFAALVLLMFSNVCVSQTNGVGCRIGNYVYTQYLGIAYPYGPSTPTSYYNSSGPNVAVNYNNYNGANAPTYYGYICGKINIFPSSAAGPAQQEAVDTSVGCIISPTLGGSVNGSGVRSNYSYNNPTYCSGRPVGLPLDENMNHLSVVAGILGFFIFRRKVTGKLF